MNTNSLEQLLLLSHVHVFHRRLLESHRIEPRHVWFFPSEQVFDGHNLNLGELAVVGLIEASGNGFLLHRLGWLGQGDEHPDFSLFPVHSGDQVLDHRHAHVGPALDRNDGLLGGLAVRFEVDDPVDAGIRALLLAAVGYGVDQRHGPPLELILVPLGQVAGAGQVLGRAVNFEGNAGKGVLKALLDQADGQVGDVDPYPLAAQLMGGVNRRPATAEGVKHHVAGVAAGLDDTFQQGKGFLCRIAKTFGGLGSYRVYSHLFGKNPRLQAGETSVLSAGFDAVISLRHKPV